MIKWFFIISLLSFTCKNAANEKQIGSSQLKSKFPFNIAKRIDLVSFQELDDSLPRVVSPSSDAAKINLRSNWIESVTLDDSSSMSLAGVLFNCKNEMDSYQMADCYNPRNAVLFFNESGKPIAGIEICFECNRVVTYPDSLRIKQVCAGKMEDIRQFFISQNVKYGAESH